MNPNNTVDNDPQFASACADVDATLRLVASVSAPQGLEDRVHAALRSAPRRGGRILEWPSRFRTESAWMRSAAAAAICFVVVGGGWGVYSRVQTARVIAMPSSVEQRGFSNAGAKRTPQTLSGPVINHAPGAQPAHSTAPAAAIAPHVVEMPAPQGRSGAASDADKTAAPQQK
jgi:hypothetical protein